MSRIAALILAAGESRRMGSPKMLLPFKGATIIERVIENVLASEINSATVVLGAEKERILSVIKRYGINSVINENYRDGMLSSVRTGLSAIRGSYDAVMIFPGDMPLIAPGITNTLIGSFGKSSKRIIIPVSGSMRGHPILISSHLHDEIGKLDDNEGLRQLAVRFPDEVLEISVDDHSVLKDIDTREEYLKEINQI